MNAKERRYLRKLEIENEELRKALQTERSAYSHLLYDHVSQTVAMRSINELLLEAGEHMRSVQNGL